METLGIWMDKNIKKILFHAKCLDLARCEIADFRYNKQYGETTKKLHNLKNKFKNKRCFVLGTGPSLKKTNLNLIKNKILWGVNSLIWEKIGLDITFFGLDSSVPNVTTKMLNNIAGDLFLFGNASRKYFGSNKNGFVEKLIAVKKKGSILKKGCFPNDISKFIYGEGGTSVISCLQLIYYMGFTEVYLLGCDCDYSGGHFTGYERIPFTNHKETKHWKTVFDAYAICKNEFEKDGKKIYNATVGGKLEVFERKELEDIV